MLDRTSPPKSVTPDFKAYSVPAQTEINRKVKLYSLNQGKQEVFKLEIIFSSGSANSNNPALASFCVSMLREGSTSKSL